MESLETLMSAGFAAAARGDIAAAAEYFIAVGASYPDDKHAVLEAAKALRACGDTRAAAAVLELGLQRAPRSWALHEALAETYTAAGMDTDAVSALERSIGRMEAIVADAPGHVAGWIHIGRLRTKLNQRPLAEAAYRRAVEADPHHANAALHLGALLMTVGKLDEARPYLAKARALDTTDTMAQLTAQAGRLLDSGANTAAEIKSLLQRAWAADQRHSYGIAREIYEAVLTLSPGHVFALSRLLTMDGIEGRLTDAETHHRLLAENLAQANLAAMSWMHLAVIAYQAVLRPLPHALYMSVAAAIDRQLAAQAKAYARKESPPRDAGRRLKVGYLSSMLRDHPIGHVTAALFGAHDRSKFEVHVFYLPEGPETSFTRCIAGSVEHFITLPDTAEAMTQVIGARALDVLVYLDGYMSLPLLPVVAARPAPVQVFWLGHAGNCEIEAIDYVLADATVVPPGEEHLYTAKVIRLPGTYHCASPHPFGAPMTRAEAGLPAEGFVFCAFNNPEKIDAEVFAVWMRILARVDRSVLWLSRTLSPAVEENLRCSAEAAGIDGRRLVFAARLPDKSRHLARHLLCGLFLDTLTLNASTTALDALGTSLPLLTVTGARYGARIAASFLWALGLEEMIAPDLQAYEDRAVLLATHPDALAAIHSQLPAVLETRPLFQIESFCRGLEASLERICLENGQG